MVLAGCSANDVALSFPSTPAAAASAASAAPAVAASVLDIDWAHLNSTTLAGLDPSSFLSLTATQLASIPATACSGFTQAQMANTGSAQGSPVCGGFQPNCFASIMPLPLGSLTAPCAAALQPATVGQLTSDQAHFVQAPACGAFNFSQSAALGAQCGSFSPMCVGAWNVASVPGLQYNCIASMNSVRIASFSATQISAIDPAAVVGIQGYNCGNMAGGCAGFTATQFAGMYTSAWRQCARSQTNNNPKLREPLPPRILLSSCCSLLSSVLLRCFLCVLFQVTGLPLV